MNDLSLVQIIAFNTTLLASLASPGPAFVMCTRVSLVQGRMAGITTGAGLALMASIWTGAALMGLAALFAVIPWLYGALKIGGALYLIYLAIGMWRGADEPLNTDGPKSSHRAFRAGVLVNLANPKSVLFSGAVLAVIFPAGLGITESLFIVANQFIVEALAYIALAITLSTTSARRGFMRFKAGLDRGAAMVMGALGLRLLWSQAK